MSLSDLIFGRLSNHFRHTRLKEFPFRNAKSIIDFGGTPAIWSVMGMNDQITLLNLPEKHSPVIGGTSSNNGMTTIIGDALQSGLPDQSFEVAFSNSVIEHVGGWEEQRRFAAELRRVGKFVYC